MKLYTINEDTLRSFETLPKEVSNPTCVAIIKTIYRMSKEIDDFDGATGTEILKQAVEWKLWKTNQKEEKYHTTFAYYLKKLKNVGLKVVGETTSNKNVNVEDLLSY